jgi:RNA polymerase sigma-70 factor (ECF subfamily)
MSEIDARDMHWLADARAGDLSAAWIGLEACRADLVSRARGQLRKACGRGDAAEDVVSGVLARACGQFSSFRGKSWGEWIGWLRTIVRRAVLDDVVNAKGQDESLNRMLEEVGSWVAPADRNDTPRAKAQKEETWRSVLQLIDELPKAERTAVVLFHLKHMKVEEIAAQLGKSADAVRMARDRGVERIRAAMGGADASSA